MSLQDADTELLTGSFESPGFDQRAFADRVAANHSASGPGISADARTGAVRGSFLHTLSLRHAGPRQVRLSFEWQGPADAPVLLVAGGISAHRHVAASSEFPETGWWPEQAGPGRALDPAIASACSRSTGSAPMAAWTWPIDSADQADAFAAVLDYLGIVRVAAFVGCSYGAMVGLQFAARHGSRLDRLLAISGADRAHPYSSAWRALQRRIVALGRSEGGSREALSLARQLAMLSYRTPEEFAERFAAPVALVDGRARCAAEDYLDACGSSYVARTPLTAFLRLSESIDLHDVAPETVTVPTVLVAIEEDRLVPAQIADLAGRAPARIAPHCTCCARATATMPSSRRPVAIAGIIRSTLAECRGEIA